MRRLAAVAVAVGLIGAAQVGAWGGEGHRLILDRAIQLLPPELRAAFDADRAALLEHAAAQGLPGEHHFYLTFRTAHAGVGLSPGLHARYPGEMTIVLEHQFWDLAVGEDAFSVTLRFGGAPERLHVPFAALVSFADPGAEFGLRFDAVPQAGAVEPGAEPGAELAVSATETASGNVVDIRAFRRPGREA